MKLQIPVSLCSPLAGRHDYTSFVQAYDMICNGNYGKPKHPRVIALHAALRAHPFSDVYCLSPVVSEEIRTQARKVVEEVCKHQKIWYHKPWGFYAQHRGRVLEDLAIATIPKQHPNKKIRSQVVTLLETTDFTIRGKVDCVLNGIPIEIKSRMNRLFSPRRYSLDQLAFYIVSLKAEFGKLCQFFRGRLVYTKLTLDQAQNRVNMVLSRMTRNVRMLQPGKTAHSGPKDDQVLHCQPLPPQAQKVSA